MLFSSSFHKVDCNLIMIRMMINHVDADFVLDDDDDGDGGDDGDGDGDDDGSLIGRRCDAGSSVNYQGGCQGGMARGRSFSACLQTVQANNNAGLAMDIALPAASFGCSRFRSVTVP